MLHAVHPNACLFIVDLLFFYEIQLATPQQARQEAKYGTAPNGMFCREMLFFAAASNACKNSGAPVFGTFGVSLGRT
jgi:hypothetical protein